MRIYCHDNILIGDFGITIIDFSRSRQSSNQKAKDGELSQLRRWQAKNDFAYR